MSKKNAYSLFDFDSLKYAMKEPLLSKEEELTLAQSWNNKNDEKALNKLVVSHVRLVVAIAFKFRHYGLSLNDLIQEGILGLMQAAQRFEADRNTRFSSYCKWWIKASIQDYILRNWSIVRMGSTTPHKMLFFHLNRLRVQLGYFNFESMSDEDLKDVAEKLSVQTKEVNFIEKRLALTDLSLNADINNDTENVWIDLLEDSRPNPEDLSINSNEGKHYQDWINLALNQLNDRERYIIVHRRLHDPSSTLESVGESLGITKERVRQLEFKAIRKMGFIFKKNLSELRNFLS